MKITDKHVFFWGTFLSNWYPCEFNATYEGKEYTFYNSEQYFMFLKAKKFGDNETAELILEKGKDPKAAKDLGRLVKNYDDKIWNECRYQAMFTACYCKFSKCNSLKTKLLSEEYKGKGFVEASPTDQVWGIGVHFREAKDDESTWNGKNLLGKVLDEVREVLEDGKI